MMGAQAARERPAETASPRILIVGSSFVGAVRKALRDDPALGGGCDIAFAAAGRMSFGAIDLADGAIVNHRRFKDDNLRPVAAYRHIFVYGIFPTPFEVSALHKALSRKGYSSAVVAAAIDDHLNASETMQVVRRLRRGTEAPIHILSTNVPSIFRDTGTGRYRSGIKLIRRTLGAAYLEFPDALFDDEYRPRTEFYKGSVDVTGEAVAGDAAASHDVNHLNESGGALVLRAMIDRVKADARA